ncbi:MAG: hypothetical protein KGP14_14365 [Betaproteobacteria bacterium]|nr:hypothetical protein [Betaproteobacteria bacterium]
MEEYPKMIYRDGDGFEWEGHSLESLIVADAGEEEAALADGWRVSPNPLDHDGDGKPGGARRGRPKKVVEE